MDEVPVPTKQAATLYENNLSPDVVNNLANPSTVDVTLVGCGGCGINLARMFKTDPRLKKVLNFDTSMTNTRRDEEVYIITNGSGSGSNRGENAKDIERAIPMLTDEQIGKHDVAIVVFSLAGGSGSVIGPLMLRDYKRRNVRAIGVVVSDTGASVNAKNTKNTLKTLTAIAAKNDMYLPLIVLSNDASGSRGHVDDQARFAISDLIEILTAPVFEVDRNDRLNWIDPSKIISTSPGIKLIGFSSEVYDPDEKVILGTASREMVDSLLILQRQPDDVPVAPYLPARLKKTGFYYDDRKRVAGRISSDINSINQIVDSVEKMENAEKAQKHSTIDRLSVNDSDDELII